MSSFTYSQLVQALQDWPEKTDDDYVAAIPRIIGLGETRLVRELNLELFDYTQDLLATQDERGVAKPDSLVQVRTLDLISDAGVATPILLRSYAYCVRYAPDPSIQGTPKFFAELDESSFYLVPTPDDDYSVRCRFIRRPDGLSASNTTTWLSEICGDVLFAACLMESEHYIKADDRYGDMRSKYYEELLPVTRLELRRSVRMGDYTPFKPAAKPAG